MLSIPAAFSASYREARVKFLEAAAQAGLLSSSIVHPEPGVDGEELAIDLARSGAIDAEHLLIVSSGCHGVEGYCGSGVQVFALHDAEWRERAAAQGVAVLYLHALNPWGFSWTSRTTHENIDLNRNFTDFRQPLPRNPGYAALHQLLLPERWPPGVLNQAALMAQAARHGMRKVQEALSGGQHEYPDGLFFGGLGPSWSHLQLRRLLREQGAHARRIAWVDLHTGLGPSGVGERIYMGPDLPERLARTRVWWGSAEGNQVTVPFQGGSVSAPLSGTLDICVDQACPEAESTCIALEFGTVPLLDALEGLRARNWLHQHPDAPAPLAAQIRQQVRAAFYTETDAWKGQVISQARQALFQAIDGLTS